MARSVFVAALLAAVPFTFIGARPAAIAPRPVVAQADTVSPAWVTVPAGTFEMGCVPRDDECFPQERPRHTIRISRPFQMMTTEVTLGMYRRRAAPPAQPVWNTDDRQPVVNVTWCQFSRDRRPGVFSIGDQSLTPDRGPSAFAR